MQEDILLKLSALKNNKSQFSPDPVWVSVSRKRLLSQIKNTVSHESEKRMDWSWENISEISKIFVPARIFAVARVGVAVILIGVLTVSGWIASVSASYNSLPGEPMYQVKMATEKTELLVASVIGNEKDKVTTLMKHATNRVGEYKRAKSTTQAKQAIQSLKETMKTTNEALDKAGSQSPDKAIGVAQVVNEQSEQILAALGDGKPSVSTAGISISSSSTIASTSSTLAVATTSSLQLTADVVQATGLVEAASMKAVEVILEKNIEGGSGVDMGSVKHEVEKKLDKVVGDFAEINKDAALVNSMVGVASSTISGTMMAVISPNDSVSSTPDKAGSKFGDGVNGGGEKLTFPLNKEAAEKIQGTEQKMAEASKTVEKAAAEVKTMIGSNDLLGAIKKVQEMSSVKNDAKAVVTEAKRITGTIVDAAKSIASASTTPNILDKLQVGAGVSSTTMTSTAVIATSTHAVAPKTATGTVIDVQKPAIKN